MLVTPHVRYSIYSLSWYKSTNTDAEGGAGSIRVSNLRSDLGAWIYLDYCVFGFVALLLLTEVVLVMRAGTKEYASTFFHTGQFTTQHYRYKSTITDECVDYLLSFVWLLLQCGLCCRGLTSLFYWYKSTITDECVTFFFLSYFFIAVWPLLSWVNFSIFIVCITLLLPLDLSSSQVCARARAVCDCVCVCVCVCVCP